MEQQTLTRCPRCGELAGEALVDDPPCGVRGGRRKEEEPMWVFTTDGFLSAVEERRRDHRGEIVIRAREASALEALREIAPTLTPTVIYGDSDYRYRAWLGPRGVGGGARRDRPAGGLRQLQERSPAPAGAEPLRGGAAHGVVGAGADATGRPPRIGRRRLPAGAAGGASAAPCVRRG